MRNRSAPRIGPQCGSDGPVALAPNAFPTGRLGVVPVATSAHVRLRSSETDPGGPPMQVGRAPDAVSARTPGAGRPKTSGPGRLEREVARRFLRDGTGSGLLPDLDPAIDMDGEETPSWARPMRIPRRRDQDGLAALRRSPMTVAAALLFARAIDAAPSLLDDLRGATPRVVVDVPDAPTFSAVRGIWSVVLRSEDARVEPVHGSLHPVDAGRAEILSLVVAQVPKSKDREDAEQSLLRLLQVARPLVCLSPDAGTHLPSAALRAADYRVRVPRLDPDLVGTVIRIVTGRRRREVDAAAIGDLDLGLADLAIAVRADRSPAECVARLRRLHETEAERSGIGRDLSLDQLHGMSEAVGWARSTLADIAAWRAGAPWSEVSSGAVVVGPPGTGKTLMASVMATEGELLFVTGSLACWQAEDQAHLGTTIRAMRRTVEEAVAKAKGGSGGRRGCILLIDEIDSFPDRATVLHDHRDYTIQVVNALLELLDGATSREGVIVIGTTNAVERCDPALLRPGRLSKILHVGYPDLDERVAMLRVRLGTDLHDGDLLPVARVTERATGAAIEELVTDARRLASRAERPLRIADLLAVAGRADRDVPPAHLRRTAVHEAGHALLAALELGTENLVVALQSRDGAAGWVELAGAERSAGTRAEIEASIRILLAGRAAEEVVIGDPSAGAHRDLAAATSLAAHMVGTWGLAAQISLMSFANRTPSEILLDPELRTEATCLLDDLYEEVCGTVRERREAIERIADRLLIERRLDGHAVAAILGAAKAGPPEGAGGRDPWGIHEDPVAATAGSPS